MSATDELRTDRIDGTIDDGNALTGKFSNFEAAMRHIFGIPADTVMSEAMQIASDGDVVMTGVLTLAGEPTTDLMAATKTYLQSNSSGMGEIRSRVYLTSNQLLVWPGGGHYIAFDAADINEGGVWESANPSRLTIPEGGDGDYLVGMSASFDSAYGNTQGWFRIYVNRIDGYNLLYEEQSLTVEVACSGAVYIPNLVEGDYLEFYLYPRTFADNTLYAANTTFWMFNLE